MLELALERDPIGPGVRERSSVHLFEVRRIVGAAVFLPPHPFHQPVRSVRVGQPHHETGAVQIRVDLELEVDLGAFRHKAERIVEVGAVAHHGAEDHLVVATLGASDATGHPGVDEDGDPFVIPTRRGHAGRGQIHVENRFRLFADRIDLAPEESAEHAIAPRSLVHGGHVHQFVVHDRVHPLISGDRLERKAQRGDLHHHRAAWDHGDPGVAVVLEVREQHGDVLIGLVAEQLGLEGERVEEGPDGMRDEVRLGSLEVDEPKVRALLRGQLGVRWRRRQTRQEEQERDGAALKKRTPGCPAARRGGP